MADYKIPGEHIYDGMVFGEIFPADVLDAVKKFQFKDDDILIATYPKAGKELYKCNYRYPVCVSAVGEKVGKSLYFNGTSQHCMAFTVPATITR